MTDSSTTVDGGEQTSLTLPMSVYILYLMGMMMVFTAPVGVVIAHGARKRGPDWVRTHYRFQIRTFWLGLPVLVAGVLLAGSIIGYLLIAAWVVWAIGRCAAGINYLSARRAVPEPASLWLGGTRYP